MTFVYASMTATSPTNGNKITYDVEIQVAKGWNLVVASPVWGDDAGSIKEDSEIQKENIKASYYYFRQDNKYLQLFPNEKEVDDYLRSIQTKYDMETIYFSQSPVWIYSNKDGVLKYTRKDFPKFDGNLKLYLSSGWNFVTITSDISTKTFDDIKGDCNAEKLYVFVSEINNWQAIDTTNGLFGTEDVGKGFIVKVTSDCTLGAFSSSSTSSSDINPPQIPQ